MHLIPHTLSILVPHAQEVSVVGDFNNWHSNAHPLVQVAPGRWERILDLPPGAHRYAFFVVDDLGASQGAIRTHIVGQGSFLGIAQAREHHLKITPHPALALAYERPHLDYALAS